MLRIRSALHQDLYLNFDPQVAHLPIYAVFAKNPWLTKVLPPYLPPVTLQVKFVLSLHSDTYYKAPLEPCCASNPLCAAICTPTSTPMARIYRFVLQLPLPWRAFTNIRCICEESLVDESSTTLSATCHPPGEVCTKFAL